MIRSVHLVHNELPDPHQSADHRQHEAHGGGGGGARSRHLRRWMRKARGEGGEGGLGREAGGQGGMRRRRGVRRRRRDVLQELRQLAPQLEERLRHLILLLLHPAHVVQDAVARGDTGRARVRAGGQEQGRQPVDGACSHAARLRTPTRHTHTPAHGVVPPPHVCHADAAGRPPSSRRAMVRGR